MATGAPMTLHPLPVSLALSPSVFSLPPAQVAVYVTFIMSAVNHPVTHFLERIGFSKQIFFFSFFYLKCFTIKSV